MPSDNSDSANNSPRVAVRLQPLSEIILFKLYRAHIEDDSKDRYSFVDIQKMLAHQVSRKMILSALTLLNSSAGGRKASVSRYGKGGEYEYWISTEGIFQTEEDLNRGNSIATYLTRNAEATIEEIAGFDGSFFSTEERLEAEAWKPLPIDRSREAFKKALRDVEDAYDAIRGDNGFASEFPDIRKNIVTDLETGIEKFKKDDVSLQQLKSFVISPLKWIAANFGNSVIGAAAKNAGESLWRFIQSLM